MGRSRFVFRGGNFLAGIFFVCLICGALAQAQQTAFDLDGKASDPMARAGQGRGAGLSPTGLPYLQPICSGDSADQQHYENDTSFFLIYPDKMSRRRQFANISQSMATICPHCATRNMC